MSKTPPPSESVSKKSALASPSVLTGVIPPVKLTGTPVEALTVELGAVYPEVVWASTVSGIPSPSLSKSQ